MHDAARQMIDAAERIAAERGLAALTVQAVQKAAGQRNKSAVQYHFGGRQGLVNALLATRMAPASARRTSMLLTLGDDASIRDLVEVLILPLVESVASRQPSYWARFLIQALTDPATGLAALEAVGDEALDITQTRLADCLEHLTAEQRTLRVQSVFGYVAVVLSAYEVGVLPPHFAGDALADELIDACCGLLGAPLTTVTHHGS